MSNIRENVSLGPYTTFGIEAKARWWIEPNSEQALTELLMDHPSTFDAPVLVMGGGSNLLFSRDFDGLLIHNAILGREVLRQTEEELWLRVGGGENWHQLVLFCLEQNWGGLENLSLIPGSAGAAPIQNIGAYGVELTDVFDYLEALHLKTGQLHVFSHSDCRFGYRDSVFKGKLKGQYCITRVVLRLTRKNHRIQTHYGAIEAELEAEGITHPTIQDISRVVCQIRRSKLPDPAVLGNAGSFFKNPVVTAETFAQILERYPRAPHYPQPDGRVKVPAGWLIETCGWKGKRRGACGVHAQQALVLVNYGGATGAEIRQLSDDIRESVQQEFGILLEGEVNII